MRISLSDHFSYGRLLRFTVPSIIMMIFTSVYGVVDGFFVSNFVGKTPFAAVNFIMPLLMMLGSFGFMFGAGGGALIAKTLGGGDNDKAQKLFSMFVYITAGFGVFVAIIGTIFIRPIAVFLGAEGEMFEQCITYGHILLIAMPFYMLQYEFQSFFITAEKPKLGLAVTLISGFANMILDALFMAVFSWGVVGAAAATAISQIIGGVVPILYFSRKNKSLLRLRKTGIDIKALFKACSNGSSELMSNISMSIVSMLYNIQLMKYAGEDGIAAYGVLMYVCMIFIAIFIGYSTGIAPVVGYHFGADNRSELKNLRKKSIMLIGIFSVCMFVFAELMSKTLAAVFVGYDEDLLALTVRAFRVYSFSFLFCGISIFGSSFFTALNDGLTSALISFLRSLVFQVAAVIIFPLIWKTDGIWLSIVAAEIMSIIVTVIFLFAKRKKYGY